MRYDTDSTQVVEKTLNPGLKSRLMAKIPVMQAEVRDLLKAHGDFKISDVTLSQAYGGMRGVKCMVTETSSVDPYEGIRFRNYTIPELREQLPKAAGGHEPLPEGVFHLLLTGELPLGRFAPPSHKVAVDVKLDEVVLKTLAKEPELRYQRASEVQTDIEGVSQRADEQQRAQTTSGKPGMRGLFGKLRRALDPRTPGIKRIGDMWTDESPMAR